MKRFLESGVVYNKSIGLTIVRYGSIHYFPAWIFYPVKSDNFRKKVNRPCFFFSRPNLVKDYVIIAFYCRHDTLVDVTNQTRKELKQMDETRIY